MPYKDRNKKRQYQLEWLRKRRSAWFAVNGPCQKCGSNQNLEVHHVNYEDKIDHKVWSWAQKRREAELAKCIVLCKECHDQVTKEQFGHSCWRR